jgi:hypothetical protein
MRRFLLTTAAVATTLLGAACGDSSGLGGNAAGSYELLTINGQSLPVTTQSGRTIEAGQLDLDNDGTFFDVIQYRTFGSSLIQTEQFTGFWERNGSEIRLDYDNSNDVLFAERTSSSRLVLTDDVGNEWGYRRF